MNFLKNKAGFLVDIFLPRFCLGCGQVGSYLCSNCQNKIKEFDKQVCFYCQQPSPFNLTHSNCKKTNHFDGFLALYQYNSIIKLFIKNIKYRRATKVWQELSLFIKPQKLLILKSWSKIDFIQPIPLHQQKLKERGFNQAKLIAQFLTRYLKLPIADFIWRKKKTKNQAELKTNRQRYLNLKGAFRLYDNQKQKIKNKNILLVDDVITSGTTIGEATKVLKNAGAKNVFVFILAKS